jgi:cytochrome c biogenesis protein CcmG/thiol:disulfide interchange protein DsbE
MRRLGVAAAMLAAGLFVALLVYGVVTRSPDRSLDESLAAGEAVRPPGFELDVLETGDLGALGPKAGAAFSDRRLDLAELRGTPVVLNFWASWCDPCREEAPLLERVWKRERERGEVLFLGLDQQDLSEDARAFMREFGMTYPVVRDGSNGTSRDWGVTGLPETWFVSADGKVTGHVIGVIDQQQLAEGIASARSGRPVGAEQGGDRRSTR